MAVRTFNDEIKQTLLDLCDKNKESDIPVISWIYDCLRSEPELSDYAGDVNSFYEAAVDKNNTSRTKIESIFDSVEGIHSDYTGKFENHETAMEGLSQRTKMIRDLIHKKESTVFESSTFLSELSTVRVEGLYTQYLADGDKWRADINKDHADISDEEYIALASLFATMNDEKDIEDFLRGMMVKDLDYQEMMDENVTTGGLYESQATSMWTYDQDKLKTIMALLDSRINQIISGTIEIASWSDEDYLAYCVENGIDTAMTRETILDNIYDSLGIEMRNLSLLEAVKDDVYFGTYDLTEPPDSSMKYSADPASCFKVIIDENNKISIATLQEPFQTIYDDPNYSVSKSVDYVGCSSAADQALKDYIKENNLKETDAAGIGVSVTQSWVTGQIIGKVIKYGATAVGASTGVIFVATTAVSITRSAYSSYKTNETNKQTAALLDDGTYASNFGLATTLTVSGNNTTVTYYPTYYTQERVDKLNAAMNYDASNEFGNALNADQADAFKKICEEYEVYEFTTDTILEDAEKVSQIMDAVNNNKDLEKKYDILFQN